MKVLISAYACEPNLGSEPFLGWRWVMEIAKHHSVWVLTRDNNSRLIEEELRATGNPYNVQFIYVGLNKKLTFWKKGRRGMKLFYTLWQRKAVRVAKALNSKERFDLVHHITFGAYTQPTYMYKLDIPFVWGPLGGGEKMPLIKGRKIDFSSKLYEFMRNLQISVTNLLPYARSAMEKASAIIVTTEETKQCFPKKYHNKITIMQSLGIDEEFIQGNIGEKSPRKIRILMVGRMIGWKGFDIGIAAFKKLLSKHDNIELHLRGNGNLKERLKRSCGELLNTKIFFCEDYLDYKDMYGFYAKHDIFLNCTLHDSGCLALLEAMSAGLPIVCIDVGGPRVLTEASYAEKVSPKPYHDLVSDIAGALEKLIVNEELRKEMGIKSKQKVLSSFMYNQKYETIEKRYTDVVLENRSDEKALV